MNNVSVNQNLSRRAFLKGLGSFGCSMFLSAYGFSPLMRTLIGNHVNLPVEGENPTPSPWHFPTDGPISERLIGFLSTHEVRRGDRRRKVVLMTYDDQGYRSWMEKLLDVYQKAEAKASFFFTGDNLLLYAEQIQRLVAEGHVFGSHGLVHEPYTALRSEEIREHLREWLGMAQEIVPDYRIRYFRFPYGDRNERVRRVIAEFGLQSVHWNFESGGLDKGTFDNVVGKISNGSIVLGHMNRYYDVEYAERILDHLLGEGYSIESVETGRDPRDQFPQRACPGRRGYPEPRQICLEE